MSAAHVTLSRRKAEPMKLRADERGMKVLADLIWLEMGRQEYTYKSLAKKTKGAVSAATIRNYCVKPPVKRGPFLWKMLAVLNALGYDTEVFQQGQ